MEAANFSPEHRSFALARGGWVASLKLHPGQFDFLCRDNRFEDETFNEHAALGIDDIRAEGFAELLFKSGTDSENIRGTVQGKFRRKRAFHVELSAIKHVQFEDISRGIHAQAIG